MSLLRARTVSVSIARPPEAVYAYVADPHHLPDWAPGFALAVRRAAAGWVVETPGGEITITFAPENNLGVLDHRVTDGADLDLTVPMRVVPNGEGSEVLFTVLAAANATTEQFEHDLAVVEADLATLKAQLEGSQS